MKNISLHSFQDPWRENTFLQISHLRSPSLSQILFLYSTVFTAPLLSLLLLLLLVSSFPPLFSVTKLRTRRAYSLRLSRNKAAASSFAGEAGFGSLRSDCIATSMLVILYIGLHCDFNMSMHILPSLYTCVTRKKKTRRYVEEDRRSSKDRVGLGLGIIQQQSREDDDNEDKRYTVYVIYIHQLRTNKKIKN